MTNNHSIAQRHEQLSQGDTKRPQRENGVKRDAKLAKTVK